MMATAMRTALDGAPGLQLQLEALAVSNAITQDFHAEQSICGS